ncbi:MAG TPA: DNA-binding domain-containing protein [Alphaproteobacteria bacterium]|jgi:hypothetical protein|nr:DNA-binding domain-containing protein [Alphaproteobacteria bacterium]
MSTLRSIQAQFRAASHRGASPALAAVVAGAGIAPAQRLRIHHNHLRTTLTDALAATFPTVEKLVGRDFFGAVARDFIAVEPPKAPCLFEYGAVFPAFVAAHRACRTLPYLADVARFDWLVNVAYHAPDRPALAAERIAAIAPEAYGAVVLAPHPATGLLVSPYPLLDIWQVARAGDDAPEVDLGSGGVRLLIHRAGLDVAWRTLSAAEHAFLAALIAGRRLGEAWNTALAIDFAGAEPGPVAATAFGLGLFTEILTAPPSKTERALS